MAGFQPNWASGWQKVKPKTLIKDTLSKALVTLDKNITSWIDNRDDASLKALGEGTEKAIKAGGETSASCNKVLHKDGIKNIEKICDDLIVLRRGVAAYQSSLRQGIDYMKKAASEQIALANAALNKPQHKIAKVVAAESMSRVKKMDTDVKKFFSGWSPGEQDYSLRMQAIHRCGMTLDRLEVALGASKDQVNVEVSNCLLEIKKEVGKLQAFT